MVTTEKPEVIQFIERLSIPLFKGDRGSWVRDIFKLNDENAQSNQGVDIGIKEHPFDFGATARFLTANTHHSACIGAKVSSSVGLGMRNREAEKKLDVLCDVSFQVMLNSVAEDLENTGNGYIEVVRDGGGEIAGLHHVHAPSVHVEVLNAQNYTIRYVIRGREGPEVRFNAFGSTRGSAATPSIPSNGSATTGGDKTISEIIHIKEPSSVSRWYGVPRWLSAVAAIELVMAVMQHNYDFFNNRGVPEFMLFFLGAQIDNDTWAAIQKKLKAHVGLGNARKSMAVNIPNSELKVQLEKLGIDNESEGSFDKMLDTLAMMVVSAHQVPPQLAGIMIPGKLGATNELPNAIATFQTLVCSQKQKVWSSVLGCTLGHESFGIGDGINEDSFEWKTIVEEMNLPMMDAVSQSRTPAAQGETPGRGPNGGQRPPESGSPAARIEELQREDTSDPRERRLTSLVRWLMDISEDQTA